jgi:hypothetical protein
VVYKNSEEAQICARTTATLLTVQIFERGSSVLLNLALMFFSLKILSAPARIQSLGISLSYGERSARGPPDPPFEWLC